MSKPDLRNIFRESSRMDYMTLDEQSLLRKAVYHAFYYHNQGWETYKHHTLKHLSYILQYFQALDMVDVYPEPNDLCLWPDGTYCSLDEVEEMLMPPCAMSDDFEIISHMSRRWYSEQGLDENGLELGRNDNLGVYDSDYN